MLLEPPTQHTTADRPHRPGSAPRAHTILNRPASLIGLIVLFTVLSGPGRVSAGEVSYTVSLPERMVSVEDVSGFSRVRVESESYVAMRDEGKPVLPCRVVNVLLLQGETVDEYRFTSVTSDKGKIIARNVRFLPAPPFRTHDGTTGRGKPLFESAGESAGGDGTYPPVLGTYLGTGYLRGYAVASFAVYPLQIEDGTVYLNEEITLHLSTSVLADEPDVVIRKRFRQGSDEKVRAVLSTLVINPEHLDLYDFQQVDVPKPKGGFSPTQAPSLEGSPVDYVIITSEALASEFERLADWKTLKGVPTVVRTVEWITANCRNGADLPETIRFFIRDACEKWGVEFVMLGGDADVIPVRYAVSRYLGEDTEIAADLYFACLDGSWNENHNHLWGEIGMAFDDPDLYADVYVGRVPVSDVADVATIIDKTIAYETPAESDYTDKVYLGAEVLFPPHWNEGDDIALNGADLSEYVYGLVFEGKPLRLTRAYESYMLPQYPGSVQLTRQAIIDSMVAGVNIVNHIGHGSRFNFSCGDASVIQSDVDALTNGDRLFTIFMVDCRVSEFDYNCIAENFMRNPNGGAVATIGASHLEFPTADVYYMKDFYDLVFNDHVVRIGEAFARSRLLRTPWAEMSDNVDLWTHYVYTMLADPELPLWSGVVDTADVFHVTNVGLGTGSILVNVTSGGVPVDSAHVCLSKGDDDYEYGGTNALGNVVFDFTAESPGSVSVVVTGVNLARHQSYITVNPSVGAYVSYADLTVDDDLVGGTFGNGDGVIDAGETCDLTMELVNTGGTSSGNVTLKLRCSEGLVSVVDSTATVGVIGAGANKSATDPVRVTFGAGIEDQRAVAFELVIEEGGVPTWSDTFRKLVHAPVLGLVTLRIDDDPPLGNGNGVNEANEEFLLYYGIKNYGTGWATGMTAALTDIDGMFVFYDPTDAYPNLLPFVGGENSSGFHIKETNTSGEHRLEVAITDLFGRVYRDTIELRVPDPPTDLWFDAGLGIDRIRVFWSKSVTPDVVRYRVFRAGGSGGPYSPATIDPVDHTVFLDLGLSPSTRYYYVATAVDGSGNESVYSLEYSISTNPPHLDGWPLEMVAPTTSPPAVGDIDGDGDLEVVIGNDYVCAWHHDGQELVDGDGDPQTSGVLADAGDVFTAAVALANLDNSPGLDIMAADLGTEQVYCFDHDGDLLPGWPQLGENDFRAAPVAGDLDGDDFNEVIAVDTRGVVYAWRSDGTEYRDGDNNPGTDGVFYRTPVVGLHFEAPTLCDLDGDHKDEIIVGTAADSIWALNDDGSSVPGFPFALNNDIAGSICAGDIDKDGHLELLAQTKGLVGKAYLINHDGTPAGGSWPRNAKIADIFFTPSPALADFNNDGYLESVLYAWVDSESKIWIFDYLGNNYPGWPVVVSDYYSEASLVVGDLTGDGVPEIVLADESRLIHAFDINGNEIDGFPVTTQDAVRAAPVICDLDQDGDVELVVSGWDGNAYVWDLTGTYDENATPWPMYQANVHRNGQIGFVVPTAVSTPATDALISTPRLLQNYPNPFNPSTAIVFYVPEGRPQAVTLKVYDVTGALVTTLVDDVKPPGRHVAVWDGRDDYGNAAGTGIYFYRLEEGGFTSTKKMLFLK